MSAPALAVLVLLIPQDPGLDVLELHTLQPVPETLAREDVRAPLERAVNYLLANQRAGGSWGSHAPESVLELGFAPESYYAWQVASHGLASMALAAVPQTPARNAALERAVDWLCDTRLPVRGSDWDVDNVWGALYGFVACVELLDGARVTNGERRRRLHERGKEFLSILRRYQALSGGWAYYDDPPFDTVPTWATSFCTALVLPALLRADVRGFGVRERTIERAVRYVRRCALPNGAYAYDLTPVTRLSGVEHINLVQGSLGRIQVCNWALARAGVRQITDEVVRAGLQRFVEHHAFLDHARTRPIPHEGYHANAGYFYFFGHYYAARAIELLPPEEREYWHARLRPHLVKTQWGSGGASDFLDSSYLVTASTSYLILALQEGLGETR
ncbi:MAG: prenyltransferase/squalene oxidase repeat-containing protein [Planctomycetota bacterium]